MTSLTQILATIAISQSKTKLLKDVGHGRESFIGGFLLPFGFCFSIAFHTLAEGGRWDEVQRISFVFAFANVGVAPLDAVLQVIWATEKRTSLVVDVT